MKIFSVLLFSVILNTYAFSAGDTIFFDDQWNKCSQDVASYYRIIELCDDSNYPYLVKDFYITGEIQMIGYYSSLDPETKEGEFFYYHENGNRSQVSNYVNGKMHGFASWYYENGKLRETGNYQNGISSGENNTYYENGNLKAEGSYQMGKKEGVWCFWYENGNKKAKGYYKNDHKQGLWKYWHENNQLKCLGKHRKGLASGIWTYWHPNGQKQSQGKFKSGLITGKWTYWYENGAVNMIALYKKGELNGDWFYYDEDGKMIARQNMNKDNFTVSQMPELFDTTINILANWKMGDKRNIEIIQKIQTYSNDSVINEETTYYDVEINIREKTEEGYIAEWRYKNLYSKDKLMVSSLMKQKEIDIVSGIFRNLVFSIELEKDGSFKKLSNREEIKQQLYKAADSVFKEQIHSGELNLYTYNYKELEQRFNSMKYSLFTDDFIENELTREIKIFFNQNGKTYQTGQKIKMLTLVDFLGVKSPSKKFIEPVSIDKSKNLLTMELKESVSPMNQYPGNFEKENPSSSFKIEETNSFTIDYHTGWVKSIFRKNVLEVGEMKTIQTLEIK